MLQKKNPFQKTEAVQQELAYPAVFHFRIIAEVAMQVEPQLEALVKRYTVKAPLEAARASSRGHYVAFSVSIEMQSRAEMVAFDGEVKCVPGVKMVL